jgi:predicted nucleic acid-binding protein
MSGERSLPERPIPERLTPERFTPERFTLDTNILIYSIDAAGGARREMARQVIDLAVQGDCWLTLQAVSEFYAAATRKGRMPATEAAAQANDFLSLFASLPASAAAVRVALAAAAAGRASYWDALLLATAAEGGCGAIVTEDLADGDIVTGVRVVNPFGADGLSPAAMALLAPA